MGLHKCGNVTKKGMGISRDFQKRLGVPFEQICQGKVGTAGHGKPMRVMGTTEMFELHLKGISKKFLVSATVIEDLVDDMNLGTSFLQSITGITGEALAMEFHEGGTKLKIGRETIDLVCTLEDDKKPTGGIRIRTPAAINEASIQLERMADEEGPDKGLGIAAVAAGQTIRKPEVFAKAKGLAWSNLKGERDIPFGLAEHPKKMMAPVQGLGDPLGDKMVMKKCQCKKSQCKNGKCGCFHSKQNCSSFCECENCANTHSLHCIKFYLQQRL